ncbi:MAG: beta-ketoacyl-ACP synthase II [Proteobacteria bacterium]|nr:beta-ketoacyl-ACP synthase II [Pseudomonadota bacterium]
MNRRVVITGLGTVSPVGDTMKQSWENAVEGRSGIRKIDSFDCDEWPTKIAGYVKGDNISEVIPHKELNRLSRFVSFAFMAAHEAFYDAGLEVGVNSERSGCAIGVGLGALAGIEEATMVLHEKGYRKISPFLLPFSIGNMATGYTSIRLNLKGPNMCPSSACASGAFGIIDGYLSIVNKIADVMICGGAESVITPLGISAFAAMKSLSKRSDDPTKASRPFDRDRDGFVMGEGAGILVLEDLDHALKRGARIYAEIIGYGMTGDAHHITAPSPGGEGGYRCMKMAMEMGKLNVDELGYINAHGTSTDLNDIHESQAIRMLLGHRAERVGVSSTKGVTGHCIGAAGGIEAGFTALALYQQIMPPTINYETPDPQCSLDYVPNTARQANFTTALTNSFGFGGTNATLAMRTFQFS